MKVRLATFLFILCHHSYFRSWIVRKLFFLKVSFWVTYLKLFTAVKYWPVHFVYCSLCINVSFCLHLWYCISYFITLKGILILNIWDCFECTCLCFYCLVSVHIYECKRIGSRFYLLRPSSWFPGNKTRKGVVLTLSWLVW